MSSMKQIRFPYSPSHTKSNEGQVLIISQRTETMGSNRGLTFAGKFIGGPLDGLIYDGLKPGRNVIGAGDDGASGGYVVYIPEDQAYG